MISIRFSIFMPVHLLQTIQDASDFAGLSFVDFKCSTSIPISKKLIHIKSASGMVIHCGAPFPQRRAEISGIQ
jgi:hypothetical protein